MSIKSKVLAVTAALTLVGGVGLAGVFAAGSASAATPSCGPACINVFSYQFGTHTTPTYTVDVLRQGEKAGQPTSCSAPRTTTRPWTGPCSSQGTVSDFFKAGLVSPRSPACTTAAPPAVFSRTAPSTSRNSTLPVTGSSDLPAFENQYSPFGVESGLCMGVAATAFKRRGRDAAAVWRVVQDGVDPAYALDQSFTAAWFHGYIPLINGSDTNFSQPFVLTYPNISGPDYKPRPQLVVTNLTGFSFHVGNLFGTGTNSNQLWGATFGELK